MYCRVTQVLQTKTSWKQPYKEPNFTLFKTIPLVKLLTKRSSFILVLLGNSKIPFVLSLSFFSRILHIIESNGTEFGSDCMMYVDPVPSLSSHNALKKGLFFRLKEAFCKLLHNQNSLFSPKTAIISFRLKITDSIIVFVSTFCQLCVSLARRQQTKLIILHT